MDIHITPDQRPLLELVRTPVVVLERGTVAYVNSALCTVFDATAGDFEGKALGSLLEPRSAEQVECWLGGAGCAPGEQLVIDIRMAPMPGQQRWMNAVFTVVHWDGREAVAGFLQDIEDKKKNRAVEQQLRQSQKMESLGRLAGGVAHDMNNTLGAIMGFASVLQAEAEPGGAASEDLQQILNACKKGRNVMLNLLGFARRGKYRREIFSIGNVVADVLELLKHSIPKKIALTKRLPREELEIHGDPTQIHHALMNVCLNAVDSMGDSGLLEIEVGTEQVYEAWDVASGDGELEKGEYAVVTISDSGRGMAPEVASQAFEPFFTTKPLGKGSGLGLPMVYGTVRNHGGAVILESNVNEGTVVTVYLPISEISSKDVSTGSGERRTPSTVEVATLLLVDDEEMIRLAGKRVLEKLGYKVFLARDGRDALRVFSEHQETISLVILDLMMPVMDGQETFERLREIAPDLPILLSSGFSKEEKAEQLVAMGADAFIQKPFDMKTLKASLVALLENE